MLPALAFAAFLIAVAQPTEKGAGTNEILVAIKAGQPVVVVVYPSGTAESGEAYADWAEYLNDFAARERSVRIVKLTPQRYSQLISAPKLSRPYNTLFLRDAGKALLYRGMILEPDIYRIGKVYMTAKSNPQPARRSGLVEVRLDMRR